MPKVFVTQVPYRKDPTSGDLMPSVNVSPAAEHGEVVILMPPRVAFHNTIDLVKQLKVQLQNYNYRDGDCVIPLGDPSVIAATFGILGKNNKAFTVLKWDKNLGRYLQARIVI
jgi:hypothetical protein